MPSLELLRSGEATKNLPNSLKVKHPEVPWLDMAGFQDKVVHGYFGVDLGVVWDTAVKDVPFLKPLIVKILHETKAGSC